MFSGCDIRGTKRADFWMFLKKEKKIKGVSTSCFDNFKLLLLLALVCYSWKYLLLNITGHLLKASLKYLSSNARLLSSESPMKMFSLVSGSGLMKASLIMQKTSLGLQQLKWFNTILLFICWSAAQTNFCLKQWFYMGSQPIQNILDQLITGVGVALWRYTIIQYSTSGSVCACVNESLPAFLPVCIHVHL